MSDREIKHLMAYYIHMLRIMRGYTQQDVSNKLGKSVNAISNWELGNTSPPVDDMVELCKMFKVTPNQMIGWDDCPELIDYISKSENAASKLEELKKQKKEIEKKIKEYSDLLNHKT